MAKCTKGKPCGRSCIAKTKTCRQPVKAETAKVLDSFANAVTPVVAPMTVEVQPKVLTLETLNAKQKGVSDWEGPDLDTAKLGRELGYGAYGVVYQVKGNDDYVIKEPGNGASKLVTSFVDEGFLQNIAAKAGVAVPCVANNDRLMMPKIKGGRALDTLSADEASVMRTDLMLELHAKVGMSHNDFHLNNVMLDEKGKAVMIDFGMARMGGTLDEFLGRTEGEPSDRLSDRAKKVVRDFDYLREEGTDDEDSYLATVRKHYG